MTVGLALRLRGSEAGTFGGRGTSGGEGTGPRPSLLSMGSFGISSGKEAEGAGWLCVTGRDKGAPGPSFLEQRPL